MSPSHINTTDSGDIYMNTELTPLLLSLNDAAQSIGVCRATFYELLNQGLIESVKIGTRRLIVQESLIDYVKNLQDKNSNKASN
jgi:excisionase family DNA binding protein